MSSTSLSSTCANQASVTRDNEVTTHRDAIGNSSSGPITGIAGKCVGTDTFTQLELQTCSQWQDGQNWVLANDGSFHVQFQCMTVDGSGTSSGTNVLRGYCDGSVGQKWQLTSGTLVNPNSNKCLDTADAGSADGTGLVIRDCNSGASQEWYPPS
ncbi:ricin-type beta-trefoil lectin domain protein [Streptomyces sp. NPDC002537]